MNKRIIYAFPGMGKSTISNNTTIIDADCALFEFIGADAQSLHGDINLANLKLNPEYPKNYIDYVKNTQADIIFINCHLSLLSLFPNVEIIYPSKTLKDEYLNRYKNRGDNDSFINYMKESFDQMIDYIETLPYKKQQVYKENFYLSDILNMQNKGDVRMAKFMTKSDMVSLISESIKLEVFPKSLYEAELPDANEIANDLFNEKIELDLDNLQKEITEAKRTYGSQHVGYYALRKDTDLSVVKVSQAKDCVWVLERYDEKENMNYGFKFYEHEERFNKMLQDGYEKTNLYRDIGKFKLNDLEKFDHQTAVDIIMNAIASDQIRVKHGQVHPYTYGYELRYKDLVFKPGGDLFELAENVVRNMEMNVTEKAYFSPQKYSYNQLSLTQLQKETKEKMAQQPKTFIPDKETEYYRHRKSKPHWERAHIATYEDINQGRAIDGIMKSYYGGDYGSMTTNSQNELMRVLCALRGYGLDYVHDNINFPYRNEIIDFYRKRGIDVASPEGIEKWIKENPGRCVYEENRNRSKSLKDVIEEKSSEKEEINKIKDKIQEDEIKR